MLISAWVRYAGTSPSLSPDGKFALIMLAQVSSPRSIGILIKSEIFYLDFR